PWLIERDGKFLQVTETIHRTAELADGSHSLDEIAKALSETESRSVETSEAAGIVANLVKTGVVRTAEGSVAPSKQADYSPLQINLKMKMLSPGAINAITRGLHIFYFQPVTVVLLTAAIASQAWVFFVHGLGGPLHQAFYTPGLL